MEKYFKLLDDNKVIYDKKEKVDCCDNVCLRVNLAEAIELCIYCGVCRDYVDEPVCFVNNSLYKENHSTFLSGGSHMFSGLKRLNIWNNHDHQNKQAEIYYKDIEMIAKKYNINNNKHVEEIKYVYKDYYIDNNLIVPNVIDKKTGKKKTKIGPSRGKIRLSLYIISIIIIIRKYDMYKHIKYLDLINDNKISISNFNNAVKKVKNINLVINKNIIKYINIVKKEFNILIDSNELIELYSKINDNLDKRTSTNNILFGAIYILIKNEVLIANFITKIKISPKKLSEILIMYNKLI